MPAVVFADGTRCRELDVVETLLVEALHTPVVRIGAAGRSGLRVSVELETGVLQVDGGRIHPTVAWVRHAAYRVAPEAGRVGSASSFHAESWSRFLDQVAALATVPVPGRVPGHVEQLVDAVRFGVAVPRTTITTRPEQLVGPADSPRSVVKPLGFHFLEPFHRPGDAFFAEVVEGGADLPSWACTGSPIIVQDYVEHARELRVYYLNGGLCAFEVRKPNPASVWTAPDTVQVAHVRCPSRVQEMVRVLASAWDLSFGAFDVLVTAADDPVFLEVNADGDWCWFERKAGWNGVTFMAAAMIHDLHVRAVRQEDASHEDCCG